jgi:hypothetical protein
VDARARRKPAPFALAVLILTMPLEVAAGQWDIQGVASGRAFAADGPPSWIDGGFGRLQEGGKASGGRDSGLRGELQLGLDWKPSETWLVHAHGVLHGEGSASRGATGGLVEGFVQFRPELTRQTALRLRAGLFFPSASFENTEALWQSPYTVTLSALNTWIGEEVRLTGLEAMVVRKTDRGDRFELAGAAFGVDEPAGALLAWRGWSFGDRLTTAGERLPLPPLRSFEPGQAFAGQQDETQPIDDLGHRIGWHARARWVRPGALRLQGGYSQNGGDRELHRGQYSWDTRFGQAGLEAKLGSSLTLVAEGAIGDRGMGPEAPGGPHVDVHFKLGYALLSWGRGSWRATARLDGFDNEDRGGTAEPDSESGRAVTLAAFWKPRDFLRLGLECIDVRGERPRPGGEPALGGRRALLEVRLLF